MYKCYGGAECTSPKQIANQQQQHSRRKNQLFHGPVRLSHSGLAAMAPTAKGISSRVHNERAHEPVHVVTSAGTVLCPSAPRSNRPEYSYKTKNQIIKQQHTHLSCVVQSSKHRYSRYSRYIHRRRVSRALVGTRIAFEHRNVYCARILSMAR